MKAEFRIKMKIWAKKIIVFAAALLGIFLVVNIISGLVQWSYNPVELNRQEEIKNSYDTPIFEGAQLSDEQNKQNTNLIANFIKYGNEKNYQAMYDLLFEDYKSLKMNSIDDVKEYIDDIFDAQKGYSYQHIVNSKDTYIYEIKVFDDLMISGSNSYSTGTQRKIYCVINNVNGELKLSLDGFVSKEELNLSLQNEYMKYTILSKEVYYDKVKFNVEIENLTDNRILTIYSNDIEYLVYNQNTEKITSYSNSSQILTTRANKIMPGDNGRIELMYERYVGTNFTSEYRLNIEKVYSYDLADYMEVLYDNPDITEKAKESYSNVYIEL